MQVNCSVIFKTNPTDRGMCCTFNALAAEKIYRESKFSESVSELQKQNVLDSFERKYLQTSWLHGPIWNSIPFRPLRFATRFWDQWWTFTRDGWDVVRTRNTKTILRLYFCPVFTLDINVIVVVRLYPDIIKLYQEKTEGWHWSLTHTPTSYRRAQSEMILRDFWRLSTHLQNSLHCLKRSDVVWMHKSFCHT